MNRTNNKPLLSREDFKEQLRIAIDDLSFLLGADVEKFELSDEELDEGQEVLESLVDFYDQLDQRLSDEPSAFEEARQDYQNETLRATSWQQGA